MEQEETLAQGDITRDCLHIVRLSSLPLPKFLCDLNTHLLKQILMGERGGTGGRGARGGRGEGQDRYQILFASAQSDTI